VKEKGRRLIMTGLSIDFETYSSKKRGEIKMKNQPTLKGTRDSLRSLSWLHLDTMKEYNLLVQSEQRGDPPIFSLKELERMLHK
jgi:hypothetical protein